MGKNEKSCVLDKIENPVLQEEARKEESSLFNPHPTVMVATSNEFNRIGIQHKDVGNGAMIEEMHDKDTDENRRDSGEVYGSGYYMYTAMEVGNMGYTETDGNPEEEQDMDWMMQNKSVA